MILCSVYLYTKDVCFLYSQISHIKYPLNMEKNMKIKISTATENFTEWKSAFNG